MALKVLPSELASEPKRLERFQREAETLATPVARLLGGGRENLYEKILGESGERPLTDFSGRPGRLESLSETDGEFLYRTWREDVGDLWVMDVAQGQ